MASVATPGRSFSRFSSVMALRPKGVAALPRPSTFEARFMIMAPMAGWSDGTSGNSRRMTGRRPRATASSRPPSRATRIRPRNSAITPTSPITSWTASPADSMAFCCSASMRPVKAAHRIELRMSVSQMPFSKRPPTRLLLRGAAFQIRRDASNRCRRTATGVPASRRGRAG